MAVGRYSLRVQITPSFPNQVDIVFNCIEIEERIAKEPNQLVTKPCICSYFVGFRLATPISSRPAERGGQKGSLSGGPGTQGNPGFRIVRFRMQNSSAQTTACGRDDVFF